MEDRGWQRRWSSILHPLFSVLLFLLFPPCPLSYLRAFRGNQALARAAPELRIARPTKEMNEPSIAIRPDPRRITSRSAGAAPAAEQRISERRHQPAIGQSVRGGHHHRS